MADKKYLRVDGLDVDGPIAGTSVSAATLDLSAQPSFLVSKTSSQDNIATDSAVTVTFDTAIRNNGSGFASNTFTAPSTGAYDFLATLKLLAVDSAAAYYTINIVTSNRTYTRAFDSDQLAGDSNPSLSITVFGADIDAADTAYVTVYQSGGTSQTDIDGVPIATMISWFSGRRVF